MLLNDHLHRASAEAGQASLSLLAPVLLSDSQPGCLI